MKEESMVKWVAANALAVGLGFLAALEAGMLIEYGFNTELHWNFIPPGQSFSAYAAELVPNCLLGATLGSVQLLILTLAITMASFEFVTLRSRATM